MAADAVPPYDGHVEWLAGTDYEVAREILQRGVAALYVVAFVSTLNQFRALLGEHGLMPVPALLDRGGARGPTVFRRWGYSDRKLVLVCALGILIASALVAGLPQLGPPWLPLAAFLALWGLYMSIVNVGQVFYGFGWEMLLLEAGFTVGFLGSQQVPPPAPILVLIAWLVFRLEFGAGMIKWRGDPAWRNLTALYYHHETQPMPGPLSRRAHLMPKWWHRAEVAGNHAAQLAVPFLLFLPQPIASIAAGTIIFTQLWLVATGNFAWLNWITIVLAFCAVGDPAVHAVVPAVPADLGTPSEAPVWWSIVVVAGSVLIVVASVPALRNLFSRNQLMNASFNRWQIGNAYGAFGSVTRERIEIVVEGTLDDASSAGATWLEYEFKGKPGDVDRRPAQFAPYHLRLDWLMWFLPLGTVHQRWFYAFLGKLLDADPATLRLLCRDPFDGAAPRFVRVWAYRYRFASTAQHRETGAHWVRDRARLVIPAVGGG